MLFEKSENTVISVEGMHCNHCKGKVEATLKALKGVKKFEVSLENASASVAYLPSKISPADIANAVTKAGFPSNVK